MVKTASGSLKGCVLDSDMELPPATHLSLSLALERLCICEGICEPSLPKRACVEGKCWDF